MGKLKEGEGWATRNNKTKQVLYFRKRSGWLLWLVMFLTDISSLNMCGMLHAILYLEATECFPCIAVLQIYKASYCLCAGGFALPFHYLDCELKQKFLFPSLF